MSLCTWSLLVLQQLCHPNRPAPKQHRLRWTLWCCCCATWTRLSGGLMQHNGRLPYTANNGRKLQADNHMTSWNVAAQAEGGVEQKRQNRSDLLEIVRKSGWRYIYILIILNNTIISGTYILYKQLVLHTTLTVFPSFHTTYKMIKCSLFTIDLK